jgi:hypothetical protein
MAKIFEKLIFGGLHEKHAVQGNRTSQQTRYELSIGLFVPHRKHIMSCL